MDQLQSPRTCQQRAASGALKAALATYNDLNSNGFDYMAGNQFIHRGYRVHYSWLDCVRSLFELHNETWNIWIHIVGCVVFVALAISRGATDEASWLDTWPIQVYLGGVALSFALSATYHLMYVQSRKVFAIVLQFDFAGILFLLVGASVSTLYYTFYCDPFYQQLYLCVAAVVGGGGIAATFTSAFRVNHLVRVVVFFTSVCAMCTVPLAYLISSVGPNDPQVQMMVQPMYMGLLFNIPGVYFYASRVPERLAPGAFDVWGSSHQLWHLCVLFVGLATTSKCCSSTKNATSPSAKCPLDRVPL